MNNKIVFGTYKIVYGWFDIEFGEELMFELLNC